MNTKIYNYTSLNKLFETIYYNYSKKKSKLNT